MKRGARVVPPGLALAPRHLSPRRKSRQVINATGTRAADLLTPVSQEPARTLRANWAVLLPGQAVPLTWERGTGAEPSND